MFWKNFEKLCTLRGVSANGVCKELGLSNATATHWKQGAKPNNSTLKRIADYFDVTPEYLLSETDIKEKLSANGEPEGANVRFIGRNGTVIYKRLSPEIIRMLESIPDTDEDL